MPAISVSFLTAQKGNGIRCRAWHAAGRRNQPGQRVGGSRAVERDCSAAFDSSISFGVSSPGSTTVCGLFEMVADAVGELAVIDEQCRPAGFGTSA